MKAVLISTQPKWCEKICRKIGEQNGIPVYLKPVEVRKSAPKEVPFKAYLYCTNGRFDITDIDDVTSESVRCMYCGKERDSSPELPFFEYKPERKYDVFYDGCKGWD